MRFQDLSVRAVAALGEQDLKKLMDDMALAKASITATLLVKCAHWSTLPWKLCGLAHPCGEIAQQCAQQCLALFENAPGDQQIHHPMTWKFLALGCPLRLALQDFASTGNMDRSLRQHVAPLAFVPIVERVIERGTCVATAQSRFTYSSSGVVLPVVDSSACMFRSPSPTYCCSHISRIGRVETCLTNQFQVHHRFMFVYVVCAEIKVKSGGECSHRCMCTCVEYLRGALRGYVIRMSVTARPCRSTPCRCDEESRRALCEFRAPPRRAPGVVALE